MRIPGPSQPKPRPKPLVVCAGFFPDRHAGFMSALRKSFRLRFLDLERKLDVGERLEVPEAAPEQEAVVSAVRDILDLVDEASAVAEVRPDEAGRRQVVEFLIPQWILGQSIKKGLAALHAAEPVHAALIVSDHLGPNRALLDESRRLGIPSFYVEHGYQLCGIEGRHYRLPGQKELADTDYIFVENRLDASFYHEFYAARGGRSPRTVVTGSPLDHKGAPSGPASRGDGVSRILFCPAWGEGHALQWMMQLDYFEHLAFQGFCGAAQRLVAAYPGRRFEFVVKLHPTLSRSLGSDTSDYFRETARAFGLDPVITDGPISEWLAGADLQVSSQPSSVQWEAFLGGVPSAVYISKGWNQFFRTPAERLDSLLTRWGTQRFLWDGADWFATFRELLERKWSGAIEGIRRERLEEIGHIDADTAARNICAWIRAPESLDTPR